MYWLCHDSFEFLFIMSPAIEHNNDKCSMWIIIINIISDMHIHVFIRLGFYLQNFSTISNCPKWSKFNFNAKYKTKINHIFVCTVETNKLFIFLAQNGEKHRLSNIINNQMIVFYHDLKLNDARIFRSFFFLWFRWKINSLNISKQFT